MRFLSVAASALLTAVQALGVEEFQLPEWKDGEQAELEAAGWVPGALLLTENSAAKPLEFEPPKPEEIADDDKLPLEISEQYLAGYFAERPKVFLTDPQSLLNSAHYQERLGFLDYHASDSSIDLFVYIIGADQEIPSEVREEELIERFFADGNPAAVVYYYLGAPQRSVFHLSPSLTDSISAPEQNRALESSVMQALEQSNPAEQLERFLNQLSIRIYWMERMISGQPNADVVLPIASAGLVASVQPARESEKLRKLREVAERFSLPASGMLAMILAGLGLTRWLRQRASYRYPEFEVEPRLGGAHAAGVGAVISFASASLPPASQRSQVPDYMRRA